MNKKIEYITKVNGLKHISHWNKSNSIFGNFFYLNVNFEYEKDETKVFKELFKKNMTFLDIGAQSGYYTLLALSLGAKTVFSFEPDPNSLNLLNANLHLNNMHNKVYVFPFALYDIVTEAYIKSNRMKLIPNDKRFYLKDKDMKNIYNNSLNFPKTKTAIYDKLESSFLKTKIDFVKIDIEGAEFNAIKGMKKMLEVNKPIIILSIHPDKMISYKNKPEEIYHFLENIDYKHKKISKLSKNLNNINNYVTLFTPK